MAKVIAPGADDTPMDKVRKEAAENTQRKRVQKGELIPEGLAQQVLFRDKEIRQVFLNGEWFFSIIDVVGAIADTDNPGRYWSDLKRQLAEEEGFSEVYDKIVKLKMPGADGKTYPTDSGNVETVLRVVQSIKSKGAEPFKRWLAKVGYERIQETQNPEIAVKRAILNWQVQGRTGDWIEARLRSIVARKDLTDEWDKRGIIDRQYGILTNIVSKETFEVTTDQHKAHKGLSKSHNLRDHMTDLELVFIMLGEKSTAAIAQALNAKGFYDNAQAASHGGRVAGDARKGLEAKMNKKVVSESNFLNGGREKDPELLTDKTKKPKGRA